MQDIFAKYCIFFRTMRKRCVFCRTLGETVCPACRRPSRMVRSPKHSAIYMTACPDVAPSSPLADASG